MRIGQANKAAGNLAKWCQALHKYAEALKVVIPKKQKVAEMTEKHQSAQEALRKMQEEVEGIKQNIKNMEADL